MSNGNQRSVSLAEGTLNSDLRVNYELGLVLGVNEFRQEQQYFLHKDYLYNRACEGYGTVSGLQVKAKWKKGEEVTVTVSPGVAIDQFGRLLVVRDEQCARLNAWLKKEHEKKERHAKLAARRKKKAQQEDEGAAHGDDEKAHTEKKHHDEKKAHTEKKLHQESEGSSHDDEELHIYVVAAYDEYPDELVPIGGQPCNTGDKVSVASRKRDAYTIDFSWDKPAMPAWDGVRCFARLMSQVRIVSDANSDDDETEQLIKQVRKVPTPAEVDFYVSSESDNDQGEESEQREQRAKHKREKHWIIPAQSAHESLERVFAVWVQEVRPKLQPDLLNSAMNHADEARIVLARIDVELDDDFAVSDPRIDEEGLLPLDESERPYLLHTQVMQELLLQGLIETEEGGEGGGEPPKEFATLQVRNSSTLYAWVHHPTQLKIKQNNGDWDAALSVMSDDQPLTISRVRRVGPNVFEIKVQAAGEGTEGLLRPGARIEVIFKVEGIGMKSEGEEDVAEEEDDEEELGGEKAKERPDDPGDEKNDNDNDKHQGDEKKNEEDAGDEKRKNGLDELEDTIERPVHRAGQAIEDALQGTADTAKEAGGAIEKGVGKLIEGFGHGVKALGEDLEKEIGIGKGVAEAGGKIQREGQHVEQEGQEEISEAQTDEKALEKKEEKEDKEEDREDKEEDKNEDDQNEDDEPSLGDSVKGPGFNYIGYDRHKATISVYAIANHIPVRELVTFFTLDMQADMKDTHLAHVALRQAVEAERFLALWFHTDEPVRLPEQVQVELIFVSDAPRVLRCKATPAGGEFSSFWALQPLTEGGIEPLSPGELLRITFDTDSIRVGSREEGKGEGKTKTLTKLMQEKQFTCIGYDGDHTITLHHQVSLLTQAEPLPPPPPITDRLVADREGVGKTGVIPLPARPFVTVTIMRMNEAAGGAIDIVFELWFHLSRNHAEAREFFARELELTFAVLYEYEENGQMQVRPIQTRLVRRTQNNVYVAQITLPPRHQGQQFYHLRLRFPLDRNRVEVRDSEESYETLGEYIRSAGIRFEGYNGEDAIITYVHVDPSAARRTPETGR